MAAKWSPARGVVRSQPFPLLRSSCPERPGAVKGAPLLGAANRTLDGEDRSEMVSEEGKAGRKIGERWSAILIPSPAASNRRSARETGERLLAARPPQPFQYHLALETKVDFSIILRLENAPGLNTARSNH
jgi:hypothetical protein